MQKVASLFLILSLLLTPVLQVFAQTDTVASSSASTVADNPDSGGDVPTTTPIQDTDVPTSSSTTEDLSTPPADLSTEATDTPATTPTDTNHDLAPPFKEDSTLTNKADLPKEVSKFKKDLNKSQTEELAEVRQHLIDSGSPQEIIDRLDTFEAEQAKGPQSDNVFKKIIDFFTGNTDAQKEQKNIEELAKKQPFKVEASDGSLTTASQKTFDQLFPNKEEQSWGFLDKVKNFIHNGSFKNSNFDGTQASTKGGLSWVFGTKASAQVSDNPSDYLAAGNEIVFSQAIQNKATELKHDPLNILNFVQAKVEYIPYYGSKKSSDSTLIQRAGNDTDKSALLVALLRNSGIPARYRQVDAQYDLDTVNNLLGVSSTTVAAQLLSLSKVPYILFTDDNGEPLFFVIEHTYTEAYLPYGYSRGADIHDSGSSQWVPMDPTVPNVYYEQLAGDVLANMESSGFNITTFYDNYLAAIYGTSTEPLGAFKTEVKNYIATTSGGNQNLIYAASLVQKIAPNQDFEVIPGTLPFNIAADLNTYDYVPSSLRHTIEFVVKDKNNSQIIDYSAPLASLTDKEVLVGYDPATPADQTALNGFDTVYDVVPLSLVAVYTKIKVNGVSVATSSATTTLGQAQNYDMKFSVPTRTIGGSIGSTLVDTVSRGVVSGVTDAVGIDSDHVVPIELRPAADVATQSSVKDQVLYRTAEDFLYNVENAQQELSRITGGDFDDTVSRANVFNGVEITYSSGQPYSFTWKGLRIDSSLTIRYFNRFSGDINYHLDEFTRIFGLQASQEESDIFENDFGVQSIATVKGLKLVSANVFSGITLRKITSANESDIDSLTISTTTKSVFHTAVQAGNTIYTPSAPVTYGAWTGLFYININPSTGFSAYVIGEGLNGGYSACGIGTGTLCIWNPNNVNLLQKFVTGVSATILSPLTNSFNSTDNVIYTIQCSGTADGSAVTWQQQVKIIPSGFAALDNYVFRAACDSATNVPVQVTWQEAGAIVLGLIPIVGTGLNVWNDYINNTFTSPNISLGEKILQGSILLLSVADGDIGFIAKAMADAAKGTKGALRLIDGTEIKTAAGSATPHTYSEHVDVTPASVKARAASKGINASAFYSNINVEGYISQAMKAKSTDIEAWSSNSLTQKSNMTFDYTIPSPPENIGYGYAAGGSDASFVGNLSKIRMVFDKLPGGGYVLKTAYPVYP